MNIEPRKAAVWQVRLIPNPKAKLRDQFHEAMRFKHFLIFRLNCKFDF